MSTDPRALIRASFDNAVKRLEESLNQPKTEFIRDAAIQRFEFTFELAWKLLKATVEHRGLEGRSPRDAIKSAFSAGLIKEDPGWLAMIELRNLTAHTYDERLAERLFGELPGVLARFKALQARLAREA